MNHLYDGGGVIAKARRCWCARACSTASRCRARYYVDAVSNASIDVVTTASKYKETRNEGELELDYVVRDSLITSALHDSLEPDYQASTLSVDLTQDVFGGMTTVALGFTHADDKVEKHDAPGSTTRPTTGSTAWA